MMAEKYIKEPGKRTPWVILEPGRILIIGRSIHPDPGEFYAPVFEWLSGNAGNTVFPFKIELGFEYINTTSTKWLYLMLRKVTEMRDRENNASVTWFYEEGDEDMKELGFMLSSLIGCTFEIIEVEELSPSRYEEFLVPDR